MIEVDAGIIAALLIFVPLAVSLLLAFRTGRKWEKEWLLKVRDRYDLRDIYNGKKPDYDKRFQSNMESTFNLIDKVKENQRNIEELHKKLLIEIDKAKPAAGVY